jgi:large subunit ribosomal protein L25
MVRHEIEVRARPDALPESFEIDLTGLEIGDSVHISAITMPEGVTPTITGRDFTVITLAAPTVATATEDEEAAAAAASESPEGEDAEDDKKEESED